MLTATMSRNTRLTCDLLAGMAATLLVAGPLLFTNAGFAGDFTNHLWLTWAAGKALAQTGHPSYFINTTTLGVFNPWFAFYGGSLYTIVGGLSELSGGHPVLSFVAVTTLVTSGTYMGMLWLGRELGLQAWISHVPAVVVVTSAYFVTNLYGRAAWTEFIATAAIAPLLASGVHLARGPSWRMWPILAFVVSVVIFTGSHNITLVWGGLVGVIAGGAMLLALGYPNRTQIRRLAMVAALALASVMLNAWFLAPDIGYADDVMIHQGLLTPFVSATFFGAPWVLLDPLRSVPSASTTPGLYAQIPVWFLGWGLVAGVMLLRYRPRQDGLRRVWIAFMALIGLLLGMIMCPPLWDLIPFPFDGIEFPYRLGSYVFYAVAALVLVSALALQRATAEQADRRLLRALRVGLACVSAVSVALCCWQLWVPNVATKHAYADRRKALASVNVLPRSWYDSGSYNDAQAPLVRVPKGRLLQIAPSQVHGDYFAGWVRVPPGLAPIQTNIAGGAYVAHIVGLRRIGRDAGGYAVVRRERAGSGPVFVVVRTARSATLAIGWILSGLGALAIISILIAVALRRVRTAQYARRAVGSHPSPTGSR